MDTDNLLFAALFAALSGQNAVNAVIWIIIAAVVFFLLNWLIGYIGIVKDPALTLAKVIIGVVTVALCLNAILALFGKSFITW